MSALAKNVEPRVFDSWGRRLACEICGKRLTHPHEGRPRVRCGKVSCEKRHRRLRTERERAARKDWREADFGEAVRAWGGRCAFCLHVTELSPSRYHLAPLPCCDGCQEARVQLRIPGENMMRIARWLDDAHPGVPLPRAHP